MLQLVTYLKCTCFQLASSLLSISYSVVSSHSRICCHASYMVSLMDSHGVCVVNEREVHDRYSGDMGRPVNQCCENQRWRLCIQQKNLKARVVLSWLCCPAPILPPLLGMTRGVLPSPQYESDGATSEVLGQPR